MSNTDYFRRPALAGNTLTRTQAATLRGSIRRTDADGFSTVPYFSGLAGKSLSIKIESTTYAVASFVDNSLSGALASINAVIGGHGPGVANGEAFDTDGTITLRSITTDGSGNPLRAAGYIEVVGGTAAALLGFDITYHAQKAVGGELYSTPEGRNGNPFRTSFIALGENLSAESVNRGLGMLSSNMDVLYAEHSRQDAVLQKVPSGWVLNNGTSILLGSTISVPLGLGILDASSTKEDLYPFFQIIDAQTGQPHASRVVGVVKGPPAAAYPTGWPYANQTAWADNLGRNMLDVQVDKVTTAAISSIVEGRYVVSGSAPFAGVSVGDYADIFGATNTDQQNNNGFKWVVESVVSSSILSLRPMSKSELALVATVPNEVQPAVSLASSKQPTQSFGAITVRTGAYATVSVSDPASLHLVVHPEIPSGASIELWMAQPAGLADAGPYDVQKAAGQPLKTLASDLDQAPNGILSEPTLTGVGGATMNVGAFYVRWHGRTIYVPAQAITPPGAAYEEIVVYWEESSNSLKSYTLATAPLTYVPTTIFNGLVNQDPSASASSTVGFPVAVMIAGSGTVQAALPIPRIEVGKAPVLTVGHGGQFRTLGEAASYLYVLANANSETETVNGPYAHVEIVLLSDQTLTQGLSFSVPSLKVRGATKSIKLIGNVSAGVGPLLSNSIGSLTVEDLTVGCLTNPAHIAQHPSATSSVSKVTLRNLTQTSAGLPFADLISLPGGASVESLIEDCNLRVCRSVVAGTGVGRITLSNNTLTYVANAFSTTPVIVNSPTCERLVVSDCVFSGGWITTSAASPLFVALSSGTSEAVIRDVVLNVGSHVSTLDSFLFSFAGRALVENVSMVAGKVSRAVVANAESTVRGCSFTVNPESPVIAIQAGIVENTTLTQVDTDSATLAGVGIKPWVSAIGNTLTGPFSIGISAIGGGQNYVDLSHNNITMAPATTVTGIKAAIKISGNVGIRVLGNTLSVKRNADYPAYGVDLSSVFGVRVEANDITLVGDAGGGDYVYGVAASSGVSTETAIVGNTIRTDTGDDGQGTGIDITSMEFTSVSGNTVRMVGLGSAYKGIATGGVVDAVVDANVVEAPQAYDGSATPSTSVVVTGNYFISGLSTGFAGITSGNRFGDSAHSVQNVGGQFTSNSVLGHLTLQSSTAILVCSENYVSGNVVLSTTMSELVFNNNQVLGNFDGVTNSPPLTKATLVGNSITGDCTLSTASAPTLVLNSNQVTGNIGFIAAGGSMSVVGNKTSQLSINFGTSVASFVSCSGNRATGVSQITATRAEVSTNDFGASLALLEGATTTATKSLVTGNSISTTLTTFCQNVLLSDNDIGTWTHTRTSGTGSVNGSAVVATSNYFRGSITVTGAPYIWDAKLSDNIVYAATLAVDIWAETLHVSDNAFVSSGSPSLDLKGLAVWVTGNFINSTTATVLANELTVLGVSNSTTAPMSEAVIEGNVIYGHVEVVLYGTNQSCGAFRFCNNTVNYLGAASAVKCGSIGGSSTSQCSISGNRVVLDLAGKTDLAFSAFEFSASTTPTSNKISFTDNVFRVNEAAYSSRPAFVRGIVHVAGATTTTDVIFTGNHIYKPINLVTPTSDYEYLRLGGTYSNVLVNGNLMYSGGTIGGAGSGRQGENVYSASGTNFSVPQ